MFSYFFNKKVTSMIEDKEEFFIEIMNLAKIIGDKNPNALIPYIKIFGKKFQIDCISKIASKQDHSNNRIDQKTVLFDELLKIDSDIDLKSIRRKLPEITINLSSDIILPWPYVKAKFTDCLVGIGTKGLDGPWQQFDNHKVEYWLPIGIGWVTGGNHSITAGIVSGEGTMSISEVYDISRIYDYVECDGLYFKSKKDGSKIAPVSNIEFAAIFEIGRLMVEKCVSA